MSSPDKPLIVSRYQVQKDNLVSFNCPACDDGIVTNLKDATKLGLCPKCRVQFVSPGTKELESLRKAHQAKLQAQKVELERRQATDAARAAAANSAPPKATSASDVIVTQQATPSDSKPLTLNDVSKSPPVSPSWLQPPSPPVPGTTASALNFGQTPTTKESLFAPFDFQTTDKSKFPSTRTSSNQSYPSLLLYIKILRIFAYVVLGIGAILCLVSAVAWVLIAIAGGARQSPIVYWGTLIGNLILTCLCTFLIALPLFVSSELVRLLIDIRMDIAKIAKDE